MIRPRVLLAPLVLFGAVLEIAAPAQGSSHREAPAISEDPTADVTDFYFFRSPANDTAAVANSVTLIANFWPMQEPGSGPNWARFGDDVLYEIKIDNTGDAKEDVSYQLRFKTTFKAGSRSFLFAAGQVQSATDMNLNVVQTFTLTRVDAGGRTVLLQDRPVPPPYLGQYTMPNYTAVVTSATYDLPDGNGRAFVGQRDDPFFADLGAVFDLLRIRCGGAGALPNTAAGCGANANTKKGVDFLGGYNVNSIALQIPIAKLTSDGTLGTGKGAILGAWATSSRPRVRILRAPTAAAATAGVPARDPFGQWVQVSRLGLPLVNEVLVPVGLKDYYNSTAPSSDVGLFTSPQGGPLLTNPELAAVLKLQYPTYDIPAAGRTDLLELVQYHVAASEGGAPIGPFKGKTYGLLPADILRLDVSTPAPASLTVNRLGALGVVAGVVDPSIGYPNGRRPQDDVVDISLTVVAGALRGKAVTVGDFVDGNDKAFLTAFPYLAAPWSGSEVGIVGSTKQLHQYQP